MLLFRYLRLWYCLRIRTSNTEPTLYVYMYAQIRVHDYTHREHLCVAVFWMLEFTRFQIAKTKRVRRFFVLCLFPAFNVFGSDAPIIILSVAVLLYTFPLFLCTLCVLVHSVCLGNIIQGDVVLCIMLYIHNFDITTLR